jgi:hypothetical protein
VRARATRQEANAAARMRRGGEDPDRIRYDIYRSCADDGKGGDITRDGAPLLTFEEWKSR